MKNSYLILSFLLFSPSVIANQSAIPYKAVEKLQPQELGSLIKKFIPDANKANGIYWDYNANDKTIIWLHKPYLEQTNYDGSTTTVRKGIARTHVLGKYTTMLSDKNYQLPWAIIYSGDMAKYGVYQIEFHPTTPDIKNLSSSECFGANFSNCEFYPLKSLKQNGIDSKLVCSDNIGGALNFTKVYLLTGANKKPTYAIHAMSSGSGGTSSNFILYPNLTKKEVCALTKEE